MPEQRSRSVVTGVDFVSVPTQDLERSRAFYRDTLNELMLPHRYAPQED